MRALARARPVVDRGADEPRRRARPRADPARDRARSASRPASTSRTASSSSSCSRPRRSTSASSTRAGSAASTRRSRSFCWRRSSASRCARTRAASGCASTSSTSRSSTTSRSAARSENRVVEWVDHLHEHFRDPAVVRDGRYVAPAAPGYSIEMLPGVTRRVRVPERARLVGRRGRGRREMMVAVSETSKAPGGSGFARPLPAAPGRRSGRCAPGLR